MTEFSWNLSSIKILLQTLVHGVCHAVSLCYEVFLVNFSMQCISCLFCMISQVDIIADFYNFIFYIWFFVEGGVWRAILQYRQCALFWFCTAKKAFSWWCLAETAVWRWCSFIGSTSVISQTGLGLGNPKPFQHQRLKYQNVGAAISWTVMYVCDDSHNILQPCLFILHPPHPPPLQSSHPQSIRVCMCVCVCVCLVFTLGFHLM